VAYQSLYRKYRPQRFGDLVGAQHVTTALRNAVRDGRVGHAYLFSGPRGTGKTTTARILAKALNCTDLGDDGDPCGVCESCIAIADGTSLDVMEVDAASKSRVEEMRDLLERVAYLSAGGGKKVYILDEVHMLSASAEAALLKTLEESPEHVVFVLATTDPAKVAPTIRSRTQHYAFTLYTVDEIQAHLADIARREGVPAEPEALAILARAAAGSMRDSLSLLDQAIAHGALDVDQVGMLVGGSATAGRITLLQAVVDEDVTGALVGVDELLEQGHEPRRLTEDLLATARDAFLLTTARGRVRVDAPTEEVDRLAALGADTGAAQLVRILETLGQAVVDMRGADAADPRLVLEIALVRLARRDAGPPLAALAERVERLERQTTGAPTPAPAPAAAAPSPTAPTPAPDDGPRERPSFAEMRQAGRRAAAAPPPPPPEPVVETAPAELGAPSAATADAPPLDLDDVIIVWSEILPAFPPATKATAQEAQPIALDGDVITFGVPKNFMGSARERFKREADNIRAALTDRLGRRVMFKLEPIEGFGALPAPSSGAEPRSMTIADEPPPLDDDIDDIDVAELTDVGPAGAAVDSVGLLTSQFDATVVEEFPRD
jgi:DNA polymerase-3 subunit gamma/tau